MSGHFVGEYSDIDIEGMLWVGHLHKFGRLGIYSVSAMSLTII